MLFLPQTSGIYTPGADISTTGLDALAAIEILRAKNVIITDLHDDVVSLAQHNIVSNTLGRHKLNVCARVGDLLDPLQDEPICLDLLYENLPNLPISDEARLAGKLADGQSSSTFMAAREGEIPEFISRSLTTLGFGVAAIDDAGRLAVEQAQGQPSEDQFLLSYRASRHNDIRQRKDLALRRRYSLAS